MLVGNHHPPGGPRPEVWLADVHRRLGRRSRRVRIRWPWPSQRGSGAQLPARHPTRRGALPPPPPRYPPTARSRAAAHSRVPRVGIRAIPVSRRSRCARWLCWPCSFRRRCRAQPRRLQQRDRDATAGARRRSRRPRRRRSRRRTRCRAALRHRSIVAAATRCHASSRSAASSAPIRGSTTTSGRHAARRARPVNWDWRPDRRTRRLRARSRGAMGRPRRGLGADRLAFAAATGCESDLHRPGDESTVNRGHGRRRGRGGRPGQQFPRSRLSPGGRVRCRVSAR